MEMLKIKRERSQSQEKEENNIELNNPENIEDVLDIIEDYDLIDPFIFIVVESINNIIYLICSNINKDLICYSLINEQKIIQIKNAHKEDISNLKYFLNEINKSELIMSISEKDNNIRIWELENWHCIYNYQKINLIGSLYSACFLKDHNEIYIVLVLLLW